MKEIKKELTKLSVSLEKINPLIGSMSYLDPEYGTEHIMRRNTKSDFYNCNDILDETFYKRISLIVRNND